MQKLWQILAVFLLLAFGVYRHLTLRTPPEMAGFFQRIHVAADASPRGIEGWIGQDVALPVQATNTLRPDVVVSRRYTNVESGLSAGVLLVHCDDAHQMVGHFPLRCYPAEGWHVDGSQPRDWTVGNMTLHCTEYHFSREGLEAPQAIVVINCLLRPAGQVLRDMDGLTRSVIGAYGPRTGAGQLQIYFDASVSQPQRDAAMVSLVTGFRPALQAMLDNTANRS